MRVGRCTCIPACCVVGVRALAHNQLFARSLDVQVVVVMVRFMARFFFGRVFFSGGDLLCSHNSSLG